MRDKRRQTVNTALICQKRAGKFTLTGQNIHPLAESKSHTPESEGDRKDYRESESEDQHVRERWLRHTLEQMKSKERQKLER